MRADHVIVFLSERVLLVVLIIGILFLPACTAGIRQAPLLRRSSSVTQSQEFSGDQSATTFDQEKVTGYESGASALSNQIITLCEARWDDIIMPLDPHERKTLRAQVTDDQRGCLLTYQVRQGWRDYTQYYRAEMEQLGWQESQALFFAQESCLWFYKPTRLTFVIITEKLTEKPVLSENSLSLPVLSSQVRVYTTILSPETEPHTLY